MTVRIKIVPNSAPNADGRWIDADTQMPRTSRWREAEAQLRPFIPAEHHMVSYEIVEQKL
jgi:hypothetical protein